MPAGLACILDTAFGDLEWGKRLILWSQSATLSGERDRLSLTRATQSVRNAVMAVTISPVSALRSCQKINQIGSTWPWYSTFETRSVVRIITRSVRHKEQARASFCVHRLRIFQISWTGIVISDGIGKGDWGVRCHTQQITNDAWDHDG